MTADSTPSQSAHEAVDLGGVSDEVIDAYNLDRLPLDRALTSAGDLLRLDARVALVTGGGGVGLGNAICHRLAEQGATVAVLDVNQDAGERAASHLGETWGIETFAVVGNVADWDSSRNAVRQVAERFGTIDILVNNAGGSGSVGVSGETVRSRDSFAAMDPHDIDVTVGVNWLGVLHITKAVLEVMLPTGSGRILNISSEGGKVGSAGLTVYSSCKAAVIAFTRNLAHEIGPLGLSVAAVCPAIMLSDRLLHSGHLSLSPDSEMAQHFRRTTIGRVSLADEVASMVAFLASDAGSYVHGTAVSVGGGFSD